MFKDMLVRDGLVGKLQGVSSRYIGILSNHTWLRTVYIGRQVVDRQSGSQVDQRQA